VYESPTRLRKTNDPAIAAADIGPVDAVLLSHDHHADNLDHCGRALLPSAGRVLTTVDGAERLGGNATGLEPWQTVALAAPDGVAVTVTATPARHGPDGGDRGPVIGFALSDGDQTIYVSGDTTWYEGVQEVADRFTVATAVINAGAAKVKAAGDEPLTLTAAGAVELAHAMPSALVVPLHFEGWEHFSESRSDLERAFADAGLQERLRWPVRGEAVELDGA
jgi:L-ascorbate metabolism protein UlaG (beta-lactamase superfamily)